MSLFISKLKNIFGILIFLLIGLFIGLVINYVLKVSYFSQPSINSNNDNFFDDGLGLIICKNGTKSQSQFDIKIDCGNEFDYDLKVINGNSADLPMVLSVMLDYEQIPFKMDGELSEKYTYKFLVKKNSEISIPTRFYTDKMKNKGLHILNFVLNPEPEKHASMDKEIYYSQSIVTLHNLIVSEGKDSVVPCKFLELTDVFENGNYTGVFFGEVNGNILNYLPQTIKSKPGQKIDLPLVLGGYSNADDYLFWIYLNWEQCKLDSNCKYYYLRLPNKNLTTKKVTITAPDTKGEYEICAYLAVNPWLALNKNSIMQKTVDIANSRRITLSVE